MKLLATPGTPPILSEDAQEYWDAEVIMREALGNPERIRSVCVKFPVPVFDPNELGSSRFREVRPEDMGHPLLWIPRELTDPAPLNVGEDGNRVYESDDQRALRIAYHLLVAGLIDSENGEWVDVLAQRGFDASDPAVWERLKSWGAGGDDAELDAVDVSDLYRLDLIGSTYVAALASFQVLRNTALFMVLNDQYGMMHSLVGDYYEGDVDSLTFDTGCVVAASLTQFVTLDSHQGVPDDLTDLFKASEELVAVLEAGSTEAAKSLATDHFMEQLESAIVELGGNIRDFFGSKNADIQSVVPAILQDEDSEEL